LLWLGRSSCLYEHGSRGRKAIKYRRYTSFFLYRRLAGVLLLALLHPALLTLLCSVELLRLILWLDDAFTAG
jgi:hypothetical protein